MSKPVNNTPAFPCKQRESYQQAAMRKPQVQNWINPQPVIREEFDHPGMSLRDYIATQALAAEIARSPGITLRHFELLPARAYLWPDAMLKESLKERNLEDMAATSWIDGGAA